MTGNEAGTSPAKDNALSPESGPEPSVHSDPRRSELERSERAQRFQFIIDAIPVSTILVRSDGAIGFVNTQTLKLFGYSRPDLVGQPIEILIPERFHSAHHALRAQFFAAPSTRPMGTGRNLF